MPSNEPCRYIWVLCIETITVELRFDGAGNQLHVVKLRAFLSTALLLAMSSKYTIKIFGVTSS